MVALEAAAVLEELKEHLAILVRLVAGRLGAPEVLEEQHKQEVVVLAMPILVEMARQVVLVAVEEEVLVAQEVPGEVLAALFH